MGSGELTRGAYISYGVPGSADIIGLVAPDGLFLAVEFKTGRGKQEKDQLAYEKMICAIGGVYKIVRNEADLDDLCRFIMLRNAGLQEPFSRL